MIESTTVNETAGTVSTTKVLEKKPDVKHFKEGFIDFTAGSLGKFFQSLLFSYFSSALDNGLIDFIV